LTVDVLVDFANSGIFAKLGEADVTAALPPPLPMDWARIPSLP
jgi:hypothetical protein